MATTYSFKIGDKADSVELVRRMYDSYDRPEYDTLAKFSFKEFGEFLKDVQVAYITMSKNISFNSDVLGRRVTLEEAQMIVDELQIGLRNYDK